jgi:hypothetical protein
MIPVPLSQPVRNASYLDNVLIAHHFCLIHHRATVAFVVLPLDVEIFDNIVGHYLAHALRLHATGCFKITAGRP